MSQNVRPEQRVKEAICHVCSRELEDLLSIVLTGSMARDECYFSKEEKCWSCEGDAECLLVFDRASVLPDERKLAIITRQILFELERFSIRCPVSLSPVTMRYFRAMKPHIFGYELQKCGKVIWGDNSVLEAIPEFRASDIPKEDALRMLANRMIELLECAASNFVPNAPASPILHYRTAKLYLDMASSYLVFQNVFEAGYRRRVNILEQVAAGRPEHPFESLTNFVERVRAATLHKLNGERTFAQNANCLLAAIADVKALWNWELKQLSQSSTGMPRQSAAARLRGWAFVARKCGWRATLRLCPRWLAVGCRFSPRYSIYHAATETLFGLAARVSKLNLHLVGLLPVIHNKQPANWREIATEIGWNYHEFLEWTRA